MNKWAQLLIGLVFLIAGVSAWILNFAGLGTAALEFLKGGIMWIILLIGLVLIILGISGLSE